MKDIKKVVGIAFIKDGKLLVVQSRRSSKTNSYTFIGGGVKTNEDVLNAAVREIKEEIGHGFTIKKEELTPLMCFKEVAASDPTLMIEMTIFLALKNIDVELIPNNEILEYHWYKIGETERKLSSSIKFHFLPYAIEKGLIS